MSYFCRDAFALVLMPVLAQEIPSPDPERLSSWLIDAAAPAALRLVKEPNVVAYEIQLRTQAGASYAVPQLDMPRISSVGTTSPQTVTLSSDQAGAAIYYTLDGSQPAPRGSTSILYINPFVVAAPSLLRTRVWLAGFVASGEARALFG